MEMADGFEVERLREALEAEMRLGEGREGEAGEVCPGELLS